MYNDKGPFILNESQWGKIFNCRLSMKCFNWIFMTPSVFCIVNILLSCADTFIWQESIPLGWVPPICKLHVLQRPPLDVVERSSNEHVWTGLQCRPLDVSRREWDRSQVWCPRGETYHVTSPMTHLMLLIPSKQTDRPHLWRLYLPATSFAGGKKLVIFHS